MGHDVEAYSPTVGHLSPAQTKAAELAQQGAARDQYQAAQRSAARQFNGFTGGSGDPYLPVLTSISPSTAAVGSGAFTLTCTGSNFNEDSAVYWNSAKCPTVFVSPTTLTVAFGASILDVPKTVQVTVRTDGSTSAAKPFTIT